MRCRCSQIAEVEIETVHGLLITIVVTDLLITADCRVVNVTAYWIIEFVRLMEIVVQMYVS